MSEDGAQDFQVNDHFGPSMTLADRARVRRQALMDQRTVRLEVPMYEGIVAVEYQALGYAQQRRISERVRNVKDDAERELYIAADQLLTASINSYEMLPEGGVNELGVGWGVTLAKFLGVENAEDMTPRQAMLSCFPREQLMIVHFAEYTDWLAGALLEVDDEQRPDFPVRS